MGEEKAPLSKGAVRVSGLGDSDGPPGRMALPECGPESLRPRRLGHLPKMGRLSRGQSPRKKAPLTGELAEPARPEGLCPFAAALYKKLCAVPLDIPRSGVILVKYANEQLESEQFEI